MANAARGREHAPAWRNRSRRIGKLYERVSFPLAAYFLLSSNRFHPRYRLRWWNKVRLARRIYRNWRRLPTGISYKGHLAMAAKLFETGPGVEGVVVECGCWQGGTTANLSLICDVVDRRLIVYDSFAGLPAPVAGDDLGPEVEGAFRGDLEVVRDHVRRYGVIERCEFRKGWFRDTLPAHREPVVLCLVDVDLSSSMHDCVVGLWPHLTERGYLFFDEYVLLERCALFFSESFWRDYLDTSPPGLIGVGTGIGVGQFFVGPFGGVPPLQRPSSIAYTRKDFRAQWDYRPSGTTAGGSP
jgi:hypothetical protein